MAAWIRGPFEGQGVVDGHEVLQLARTGSAGPFETKSPLYPWLLGRALARTGEVPWTVGALGLALSLATLLAAGRLCERAGLPRAAPWAMGLYALSGSALAFAVQPLPVVLATALLAWGAVLVARPRESAGAGFAAGLLLGASAFTRAPLLVAGGLLLAREACLRRWRSFGAGAAGAGLVALACFATFGARAWPAGSAFNLRMGNSGLRSGISDVRPGPAYDRMRWEAAFAPVEVRGAAPEFEAFHRARLLEELRADPCGALATLGRKAYLFWFRTETVTSADFRHGLRGFPPARLLLLSMGLVAPLALASLLRARPAVLWLPVLGVLLVNVVWLTSARYRFPALPLLCAAAGALLAYERRPWVWAMAALAAVPLNVNLSGARLLVPGDGPAQQGHLLLARDRGSARAREALREAVRRGEDPRARYELALSLEAAARESAGAELREEARRWYLDALRLDPLYAEAGENLVRLLAHSGRTEEALETAEELQRANPYAGLAWLNAAALRAERAPGADTRAELAQGHLRMALRLLAQNALERGRFHAAQARDLGLEDPRVAPLLD